MNRPRAARPSPRPRRLHLPSPAPARPAAALAAPSRPAPRRILAPRRVQLALREVAGELRGSRRRLAELHAALALPADVGARLHGRKPYDLATELSTGIEEVNDQWLSRALDTLDSLCAATCRGLEVEHAKKGS
jgi:hypothetical protein